MIISGKNSVYEALNSNKTINKVLINNNVKDDFCSKIVELCKDKHVRYDFVDKRALDKLATHHQNYVAEVTDFKYSSVEEILCTKSPEGNFIVILDGIEDPHNFGSIIRVCDCAGVDGIIIENRRSCAVNETVYKTSCGAVNYVKIAKVGNINDVIKSLQKENIWVYALELGGENIYKTNLKGNVALVVGSEGFGVSSLVKKNCDGIVTLPMKGKINSLNASVATGIAVYEILNQRDN